jgi:hypothetical protein
LDVISLNTLDYDSTYGLLLGSTTEVANEAPRGGAYRIRALLL